MACVELVAESVSKTPFDKSVVATVFEKAYQEGILFRASGNMLIISPPLIVTQTDVDKIIAAMDAGLSGVRAD